MIKNFNLTIKPQKLIYKAKAWTRVSSVLIHIFSKKRKKKENPSRIFPSRILLIISKLRSLRYNRFLQQAENNRRRSCRNIERRWLRLTVVVVVVMNLMMVNWISGCIKKCMDKRMNKCWKRILKKREREIERKRKREKREGRFEAEILRGFFWGCSWSVVDW